MTLTLELTPEEAERIERARRQGIDVEAFLRRFLAALPVESMREEHRGTEAPEPPARSIGRPELYPQLKAFGKYAQVGGSVEEFLAQKREETAREDRSCE